ncbi:TonB-dependent receptor domain-containing protein [Stenotrophomonas mori]|uniref:TonB-dependent receptor n=1 Tax=Stenotrophomonas mori TaxID=2871096 RepID=A0ABT0SII1_9GAMM|nr:TonB-dependent receptor [Stenotrophomonas mori]MCL7714739.1 TonB-dependent receptor [Stenotrophomonas mori]
MSTAITLSMVGLSHAAYAQEKNADDEKVVEISSVNVTASGSRIDRPGFNAPTPTVKVTPEDLQLSTHNNVAAALNDLPQFRGTMSPQTHTTGVDAARAPVDLRGLGLSRTLVLLDGRRFSSDNDLASIPSILISGVDVVTGGASAAWGSGAVSGVVNVQLDSQLVGTKIDVQGGVSSRSDNQKQYVSAATGFEIAQGRGHVVIGGEMLNSDGVIPKTSRSWLGRTAQLSNGDGTYTMHGDVGYGNAAIGGLITSGVLAGQAFNPDGSLRPFAGYNGNSLIQGGESPNNEDINSLVTPQRRYNAMARLSWNLTDDVGLTVDVRHSRSWNKFPWFGDHNRGSLTMNVDNAFLPQAVRDTLVAAGETSFSMGRFNSDFAFPDVDYDRRSTQFTVALDGVVGDNWRWGGYYSHGENQYDLEAPGFLLTANYRDAVDAVIDPATGKAVCRVTLTNPNSGCVPINLFGHGSPSAEAAAYVTGTPRRMTKNKLDAAGIDLRGEPFSLPAGEVSVAVGLEARKEQIDQKVGAQDLAKAFTTWSSSPMSGSFTVREAFAEVAAPLLRDVTALRDLQINAAARFSDYDSSGSIWSWKYGLTNEFFDGFRGRFTRSRDIRSANLSEMYTTSTTGWSTISDPLTGSSINALIIGGGNPLLTPERADTLTAGFTWAPASIPGLIMSLDYFDIEIKDVITQVSAQETVLRCIAGNQAMCNRIERDANGDIEQIKSNYVNLAEYRTNGVDLDLLYTLPASKLFPSMPGTFHTRVLATWIDSLTTFDGKNDFEYVKSQGLTGGAGVPRWRGNASFGWRGDRYAAHARARYISPGVYNNQLVLTNGNIGSYMYWDVGGKARIPLSGDNELEIYADISNLFDKKSPLGAVGSPYYDVVGRYYTLGARMRF